MCLILFALQQHPDYPLILAANRDEFHTRTSLPLHQWSHPEGIYAGRDLQAGGTWLGIHRAGYLAALTNVRNPKQPIPASAPSRGQLLLELLSSTHHSAATIDTALNAYAGCNLLYGHPDKLGCYSNRGQSIEQLTPGIYGLCNHLLNTPWPKVVSGRVQLEQLLKRPPNKTSDWLAALHHLLQDSYMPATDQLPDTGVGLEWERILSPRFIIHPDYGTRCSTVLLWHKSGMVTLQEQQFDALGKSVGSVNYEIAISSSDSA